MKKRYFRNYDNRVKVSFDPAKHARTLSERGLDFADAAVVFDGPHTVLRDARQDYGEPRFISAGTLRGRMVVLIWTPRGDTRRIISMRHTDADEEARWRSSLG